jgi:hypothetical protein
MAEQATLPIQAEVRVRASTGRDDDDNPVYSWAVLLAGNAIPHIERDEIDPKAGTRLYKGTVLIFNPDDVEVPESAQLRMWDETWRVTAVKPLPHQTLLKVERIGSG